MKTIFYFLIITILSNIAQAKPEEKSLVGTYELHDQKGWCFPSIEIEKVGSELRVYLDDEGRSGFETFNLDDDNKCEIVESSFFATRVNLKECQKVSMNKVKKTSKSIRWNKGLHKRVRTLKLKKNNADKLIRLMDSSSFPLGASVGDKRHDYYCEYIRI